jgi:uncharacterized protein (DUF2147 family)
MPVRHLAIAAALVALIGGGQALAAEPSAEGLWQALDDQTHEPTVWFLIRNHDGIYDGQIVRMYPKPGQRMDVVCDQCKDDRHDKPWLGLDIIRGMKRDGLNYSDGTILDPRNGNVYSAKMTLQPDGQTLVVRGYLGISLFGQDRYWTRLPDSAFSEIDPKFNPNPTTATTRKGASAPKPANSAQR